MEIKINGEIQKIPVNILTLSDLLKFLKLKPDGRIVEMNQTIFLPETFTTTSLIEQSEIEIIQFMGGG